MSTKHNHIIRALLLYGFLLIIGFFVTTSTRPSSSEGLLRLVVLDVGQGDALLITAPTGEHILIDGGEEGSLLPVLRYFLAPPLTIYLMVATHNHSDHIGSLPDTLGQYPTKTVWITGATYTSNSFARWSNALLQAAQHGTEVEKVTSGEHVDLGDLDIDVLYPFTHYDNQEPTQQHDATIVTKLTYGLTSFLLTGDLEFKNETEILERHRPILPSTVLKVSHHGSEYASGLPFLEAVDPELALISAGKDNTYGHPHPNTLKRLEDIGATILRTDLDGTIVVKSNGIKVWVE